jgi:U3 small nucleolar RNA-associated protein 15
MAATVEPLHRLRLPAGPAAPSPDSLYWKSFKSAQQLPTPSNSPVTSLSSRSATASLSLPTPSNTPLLAATSGPRVLLVDARPSGASVARAIARFPANAHSVHFRPQDARVLVAGDEAGGIQVFDASSGSRAVLRTWRGGSHAHRQGVWVTRLAPHSATTVMSASDDTTVREWDLASEEPLRIFQGHQDYVRAAAYLPGAAAQGLIVSGSYDQTVKIWDPRAPGRAALTFQHEAPLEAVLPTPAGTTVLAAAGSQIAVLDLVGARPLRVLESHQKTVTSLCLASNDTRLVSGGLDGHVKVFETADWNVVAGFKYPSPILALDVTRHGTKQEDRHLAVGLQSGIISIKTRLSGEAKTKEKARQKQMDAMLLGEDETKTKTKKLPSSVRRRLRGRDYLGEDADIIIADNLHPKKRPRLQPWQRSLRAGKYGTALDQVLEINDPRSVVTLLVALRHRSAMSAALAGRDEVALQPILHWLRIHLVDSRYVAVCTEMAEQLLALYAGHAGQSPAVDELLRSLHAQVRQEIERAHQACQTIGMLGLLMQVETGNVGGAAA